MDKKIEKEQARQIAEETKVEREREETIQKNNGAIEAGLNEAKVAEKSLDPSINPSTGLSHDEHWTANLPGDYLA